MDGGGADKVETIGSPLQRVTRRQRAFFLAPIAAISVAASLVLWELIRQNLPADVTAHWPWKLKFFDLESGATVVTVLAVFLFTRSQYALAVRPVIGWSAQLSSPFEQEGKPYDHDHVVKILIFNGGGGVAVMTSFTYRLARNEDRTPTAWLTYDDMHDFLRSSGLKSHTDYQTWLYGPGFPLPPGGSEEQAAIVAHIRLASLLRFRIFDIKIEVKDSVGDIHERILHCRAQMRDPAAFTSRARSRHRRQPPLRRTLRDLLLGRSTRRRD